MAFDDGKIIYLICNIHMIKHLFTFKNSSIEHKTRLKNIYSLSFTASIYPEAVLRVDLLFDVLSQETNLAKIVNSSKRLIKKDQKKRKIMPWYNNAVI